MVALTACPTQQQLRQLLDGSGSSEQVDQVAEHLESCPSCAEQAERLLSQEGLQIAMRSPVPDQAGTEKKALESLVSRAAQLIRSPSQIPTRTGDPEATRPMTDSATAAPSLLGPYRLVKLLGQGGMGMVFLAEDSTLHRTVAIKLMRMDRSDGPARERFLREARAMASLKNDNIVTIYHVGEDQGTPYLVMEYLQGESLGDRLKEDISLPIPEVLRIGKEIALGLACAHEKGLIHRDVKPDNVWLESPGDRVKLLDFGLARAAFDDLRLTEQGMVVGTPMYLSPEQARSEPLDGRSDLFALGCLLYRMTTGKLPFAGTSTMAVLTSLAVDHPTDPKQLNPAVPRALAELIMRLLAKRREDRPSTAAYVAFALDGMLRHLESQAIAARRRWWRAAVAAGMIIALLVGVKVFLLRPVEHSTQGDNGTAKPGDPLIQIGQIQNAELREVSSICMSRRNPGLIWTVTNAGSRPRLYAVEPTGRLRATLELKGVRGIAWESLSGDDDGCLFVGDAEGSLREPPTSNRTVYRILEPQLPAAGDAERVQELTCTATYPYRPPENQFDSKAMLYHEGSIYLFSQSTNPEAPTRLYRLPLDHAEQVVDLLPVCTLAANILDVRDASISPDHRRLALCTYRQIFLFDLPPGEGMTSLARLQARVIAYPERRLEGCAWENANTLLLAGQLARIFRLKVD